MFSKRIISMLVVLSFISQALVVVDTDSYSSVVVEDSSILEELSEQNGARTGEPSYTVYDFVEMDPINFDYDESIFQGTIGVPTFTPASAIEQDSAYDVFAGDIDGDGDMDLVVAVKDDDTVAWFENDGGNFSSWPRSIIDGQAPESVVHVHVADMDGDGDLDVVSSSNEDHTIAWYENDGAADPSWTSTNINTSLTSVKDFDVGDIDGDGDLDITLAYANKVVWFENDGAADPSWSDGILINASQPGAMAAYAVDMDYDGDLDVVTGGVLDIVWYKNDGAADPNWTATVVYNDTIHNNGLDFADIDDDGDMDIVSLSEHANAVIWHENDGAADPSWTSTTVTTSASNIKSVDVGDADGDGDIDIVSASYADRAIAWYENDGNADPTFTAVDIDYVSGAIQAYLADMDSDGVLDIISVGTDGSHNTGFITLYELTYTETPISTASSAHWSISPSLPEGLTLNSTTGEITGIPTEVIDWTNYTVTLTGIDPNGDTYFYNGDGSTSLVKDIWEGSNDGYIGVPTCFASNAPLCSHPEYYVINDIGYFVAKDEIHGIELWRTDGTESGTYMVKDINNGTSMGVPTGNLEDGIVFNDILLFGASDGDSGYELWRTDGTEDGTYMVKDIVPGSSSAFPVSFRIFNGEVYFVAKATDSNYRELWKTDGTEEGTVQFTSIHDDSNTGSISSPFAEINGKLYFRTGHGDTGLWVTDGTEDGTVGVAPDLGLLSVGGLFADGDLLYFAASNGVNGTEPWVYDTTLSVSETNPQMLMDVYSGHSSYDGIEGAHSPSFTKAGDSVIFFATDHWKGDLDLYVTDGTPEGTSLIFDFADLNDYDEFEGSIHFNGEAYFSADWDGGDTNCSLGLLWKTDGTAEGTEIFKDCDEDNDSNNFFPSSDLDLYNIVGDTFFFTANHYSEVADEVFSVLWRTDGVSGGSGTYPVVTSPSNEFCDLHVDDQHSLFVLNNKIYIGMSEYCASGTDTKYRNGTELRVYDPQNITFDTPPLKLTFDFKLQVLESGEDTDGDGVRDDFDLDADNDGILDVDEVGLVCSEPESDDYFLDTDLQQVEGWSNASSGYSDLDDSGYLLGIFNEDNTVVAVNFPGGSIVYGNFSSEWYDRPGTDAIITTFFNVDEYEVQLRLSDGNYTDGVDDLERIDLSTRTTTYMNYDGSSTGSMSPHFMYHLIDFADFNIPPGLKVVGSKVLLKGVSGAPDIGQFVIVDDLSNGGKVCRMSSEPDIDNDGIPNNLDDDADGDGCSDILEAGFTDADGDGQLDGTGIAENGTVVGSDGYTTPADLDGDGTLDYLQSSFSPCRDLYPSVDNAEFAIGKTIDDITFQFGLFSESYVIEDPTWSLADVATGEDGVYGVDLADIDGDGDMDVISAVHYGDTVTWYENDGNADPTWTAVDISTSQDQPIKVHVADMDGDGDLDIVAASTLDYTITWYENDGSADPNWAVTELATNVSGGHDLDVGDIDGDGDMDIVVPTSQSGDNVVYLFENDGAEDPSWTQTNISSPVGGAFHVDLADMDGDGDIDIVVGSWLYESGSLGWYENDGNVEPTWTYANISTNVVGQRKILVADMDGDGDMDIVSANLIWDVYGDTSVAWYENDGNADPTWTVANISRGFERTMFISIADMDGDGDLDIVSSSTDDDTITWHENDGSADPTWSSVNITTIVDWPAEIDVADMDGDGDMDIVAALLNEDKVVWLENDGTGVSTYIESDEKTNVSDASCSISPELPLGLTMAQGTCTISGTPLEEVPNTEFLVRAKKDGFVYSTTINISSSNPDPDGDGYCDINITVEGTCIAVDAFPGDSTEWLDTDGDGIGNNADPDDDGDGLSDIQEQNSVPVTDTLNPDTDGDGYCDGPISIVDVCDATDAFPTDPDEWNDNDGDGIGDNEDPDDDNDNIP